MISIDVKMRGFEKLDAKLKEIRKIASGKASIRGVELHDIPRGDAAIGNSRILEHLRDLGFDFITLTSEEQARISDAFERQAETLLAREEVKANGVLASAYRAAMVEYGKVMVEKIEANPYSGQLSEAYERHKERQFGDAYPVGVATGQLLANLLSRTVKLTR